MFLCAGVAFPMDSFQQSLETMGSLKTEDEIQDFKTNKRFYTVFSFSNGTHEKLEVKRISLPSIFLDSVSHEPGQFISTQESFHIAAFIDKGLFVKKEEECFEFGSDACSITGTLCCLPFSDRSDCYIEITSKCSGNFAIKGCVDVRNKEDENFYIFGGSFCRLSPRGELIHLQ